MRPRGDSLISQVVAANVVLVTLTVFAAGLAAELDPSIGEQRWQFLALMLVLTFCVNLWMLQRRFGPLEGLIDRIERVDPAEPATFELGGDPVEEIDRLAKSFRRLLRRMHEERSRSGKLVLRAQEEERRRVARDLHDGLAQEFAFIRLEAQRLARKLGDASEGLRLTLASDRALFEARRAIAALSEPIDRDVDDLLAETAAELASRGGAEVKLNVQPRLQIEAHKREELLRIVREAITNATRHGGARTITIELADGDGLRLRVADDGRGFDPDLALRSGFGLTSMRERAEALGGEFRIASRPGAGTEMEVKLP